MLLCDSHLHLYLPEFDHDRDAAVEKAKQAGVEHFFLPNIDRGTLGPMRELVLRFPEKCHPMIGLHPGSVDGDFESELQWVKDGLAQEDAYCAVGEIGIDLYREKRHAEEQKRAFREQVLLAKEHGLPVVIHSRNSFPEIFEILDELYESGMKGIFHCFTGGVEAAEHIMEYEGFLFGIGGIITFRKSGLDTVIERIPLERIALETDSPYLAPEPYRGKRNEPAYLPLIAQKLAQLKNISSEEAARATSENVMKIFKA